MSLVCGVLLNVTVFGSCRDLSRRPKGWLARLLAGRKSKDRWAAYDVIALDMGAYLVPGLPAIPELQRHLSEGNLHIGSPLQAVRGEPALRIVQILPQR